MPKIRLKNSFSLSFWKREEKKFRNVESKIRILSSTLKNVDCVVLSKRKHFDKIPAAGVCYWIWTNKPILHRLNKNNAPVRFMNGEIIYNGIAKDDVRARIIHHLCGDLNAGWSGISMDIYPGTSRSHKKKACSRTGKVPYIPDSSGPTSMFPSDPKICC